MSPADVLPPLLTILIPLIYCFIAQELDYLKRKKRKK